MENFPALVFFFALFWASALSAIAPFHAFDTRDLIKAGFRCKTLRRFLIAVVIADIFPALMLLFFLHRSWLKGSTPASIMAGAVASLSVFFIPRLMHAALLSDRWWYRYYDAEQKAEMAKQGKNAESLWSHLIPALCYIVLLPLFAKFVYLVLC